MEAYKIWAALNIKGDAIEKMKIFQESIRAANFNIGLLNANLEKFSRHLSMAAPNFASLAKSFGVINKEGALNNSTLAKYDVELNKSSISTERLSKKTAVLSKELSSAAVSAKLLKATGHRFGASGSMMGVGALGGTAGLGAMVAGYGAYSALHAGFAADTERQQSFMQLKAQGFSPASIKIANDFSNQSMKGISRNELLKAFVDSVMITKELPGNGYANSRELAPLLAKAQFAATATFGKMSDARMADMARAAEIWGGSDHKKVMEGQNLMFQMMSSSAGTIDASQMQQFLAQGSGAFGKLTPTGFIGLEPVLQEIKGRRAATGLITLQSQLEGQSGTLNNKSRVKDLLALGIYQSAGFDKNGRPVHTKSKKEFTDLLSKDPFLFEEKVMEQYRKSGTTDDLDIKSRLFLDFGRTPSQELFLMHKNRDKILRQRQMMSGFWGIDEAYNESLNTDKGASMRFKNASHNLATAFGELTAPSVISGMNAIARTMEVLAKVLTSIDFKKNLGDYAVEGFKYVKNSVIANSSKSSASKISGDVYLDSRKVGRSLFHGMSDAISNSGAIGGTTGHNSLISPSSSALNNSGAP
ncbi:hypothetical protein UFOVP459_15 [uncultured Caudovirales phage]|uniref:Uncharacterized protein n=1 Tax=uncultured Caudovirales phage TaxID=2100421 RepID=A0A6J5MC10_9CAUD|nr:hypothetical protein UFOVP459_15 [uncultured Caudovirales phage]CAB4183445.1 hypothetical protein UFOVP1089_70 [uncultured Caudovirales phage]CAB4212399.1 hypothetical protein UFOVP1443_13 [uncultured Caudovirales phage]